MTNPRGYSAATRAALAYLSPDGCYNPDCLRRQAIMAPVRGAAPEIDYEIAHIRDAKMGNRFVAV